MITSLLIQDLKAQEELKAQYEKELKDAIAGNGMCAEMPASMRREIVSDLKSHIISVENYIEILKEELENE